MALPGSHIPLSANPDGRGDSHPRDPDSTGPEQPVATPYDFSASEQFLTRRQDVVAPAAGQMISNLRQPMPSGLNDRPVVRRLPPRAPPAISHNNALLSDRNANRLPSRFGSPNEVMADGNMDKTSSKPRAILVMKNLPSKSSPNLERRDSSSDSDADAEYSADEDDDVVDAGSYQPNASVFPPMIPTVGRIGLFDRKPQAEIVQRVSMLEDKRHLSRGSQKRNLGPVGGIHHSKNLSLLWARLQEQRTKTKTLRQALSAQRKKIQGLRRQKEMADNNFMTLIRPLLVASHKLDWPSPPHNFSGPFGEMQSVWSDYNVAEADYEQLENQLEYEEKILGLEEAEFFSVLYTRPTDAPQSSEEDGDDGDGAEDDEDPEDEDTNDDSDNVGEHVDDKADTVSNVTLLGISGDRSADVHPLYRDLLDAIGDRGLASEDHVDIIMRREEILYDLKMKLGLSRRHEGEGAANWDSTLSPLELESLKSAVYHPNVDSLRHTFGGNIDEDDIEFLTSFQSEEQAAREHLAKVRETVIVLRQECLDKGVMRRNMPEQEDYAIFAATDDTQFDSMTLSPENTRGVDGLEDPRYAILLTNPRHVLRPLTELEAVKEATRLPRDHPMRVQRLAEALKEYGITRLMSDFAPCNKSDYINRWLLQRLRMSPMEADILYSVFTSVLKVVNTRRWQEDVLYFWPRDNANKSAEDFHTPLTSHGAVQLDHYEAPGADAVGAVGAAAAAGHSRKASEQLHKSDPLPTS